MIIKMLMENTANSESLNKEHGLSIYIEVGEHKILFDAGQTEAFAENAAHIGVHLEDVDIAILSHGHYDHSGGFQRFLEMNHHAKLYINEHAFEQFYSGQTKEIGIAPFLKEHEQVIITSDYMKLDDGLELSTCNGDIRKYTSDSNNLYVKKNNKLEDEIKGESSENLEEDSFWHEQYLLITEHEKRVLISGCSHKGILNLVEWFQPDILIGGFHFKGIEMNTEGKEKLESYSEQLKQFPTQYYTCHCTGTEQYDYLKTKMNTQVQYLSAGDVLQL